MQNVTPDVRSPLLPGDRDALEHLKHSLQAGKPWHHALLEAVAMWTSAEEVYQGRHYRYLIGGEAFDWLLLAERLCTEVNGLIPQAEKEALLFHGRLPCELSPQEFRALIGPTKYASHLNYYYGVVVEEALLAAVEEEVRKDRMARGFAERGDYSAEAYQRLYQEARRPLLERFLLDRECPATDSITYSQYQEFTYWLFKHRIKTSEPAKVASDTRKGLQQLERLRGERLHATDGRR